MKGSTVYTVMVEKLDEGSANGRKKNAQYNGWKKNVYNINWFKQ